MINGKDGQADRRISIPAYFEEFNGAKVTKPRLPCIQASYPVPVAEHELMSSTARNHSSRSNLLI
jgi:hypothetical protein